MGLMRGRASVIRTCGDMSGVLPPSALRRAALKRWRRIGEVTGGSPPRYVTKDCWLEENPPGGGFDALWAANPNLHGSHLLSRLIDRREVILGSTFVTVGGDENAAYRRGQGWLCAVSPEEVQVH